MPPTMTKENSQFLKYEKKLNEIARLFENGGSPLHNNSTNIPHHLMLHRSNKKSLGPYIMK